VLCNYLEHVGGALVLDLVKAYCCNWDIHGFSLIKVVQIVQGLVGLFDENLLSNISKLKVLSHWRSLHH
jgi:hypothetical protein